MAERQYDMNDVTYSIPLGKLIDEFSLEEVFVPDRQAPITNPEVSRPGLALAGFLELFEPTRIQIIGRAEHRYLEELSPENRAFAIYNFVNTKCAAIIFTSSLEIYDDFLKFAKQVGVPLLRSKEKTRNDLSVCVPWAKDTVKRNCKRLSPVRVCTDPEVVPPRLPHRNSSRCLLMFRQK